MGYLNTERPPEKWSNSYFKKFVERLRTAINFIDSENFPEGLSGSILRSRSVGLASKVTGYGGLIFNQDFFANHTAIEITLTDLNSVGSAITWSPQWLKYAKVYLEVSGYVANASNVGTVEVHGANGSIISKTISDTTLKRHEWEITTMPDASMTLVFKCKANNASYPLTILSARLILKLTELV